MYFAVRYNLGYFTTGFNNNPPLRSRNNVIVILLLICRCDLWNLHDSRRYRLHEYLLVNYI